MLTVKNMLMQPRVLSVIIYSCIIGMPLAYRQEFSDTLRTICIQHDLASRTRQLLRAHNTSEQCASQSFSNAACTIFHFARTFKSQVRFMHCKQTHVQIEIVHSWTSRCGSECFRIGGAGHGTIYHDDFGELVQWRTIITRSNEKESLRRMEEHDIFSSNKIFEWKLYRPKFLAK